MPQERWCRPARHRADEHQLLRPAVPAYANPNLWGGNDSLNLALFAVQWMSFDGKMRALFSMMFGFGIVLFMQHALQRDNSWFYVRLMAVGYAIGVPLNALSTYFNLAWSPTWLRYFRFGPLEWCWRSLTYWQLQPMRRQTPVKQPGKAYALS